MANVIVSKEGGMVHRVKFDAVNLTGVWLNMPRHIGVNYNVAGFYLDELRRWREKVRKGEVEREKPWDLRRRLLKIVEERIIADDLTDLALILAV